MEAYPMSHQLLQPALQNFKPSTLKHRPQKGGGLPMATRFFQPKVQNPEPYTLKRRPQAGVHHGVLTIIKPQSPARNTRALNMP
jgi:hypothetical protein